MITFIIKNRILILIAIIILLITTISGLTYQLKKTIEEKNRHKQNTEAILSDLKRFKDISGKEAVKVRELNLTIRELRKINDSAILALYKQAAVLKVKNREIERLISVGSKVVYKDIEVPIVDTIIIYKKDTLTRISQINTRWLDASIAVMPDKLKVLNYESRDEIVIVLNWYKNGKWFLPRWFEKKKYSANIKSLNPNSKITYSKNIKIKKKWQN